jgi:hypothetical protein
MTKFLNNTFLVAGAILAVAAVLWYVYGADNVERAEVRQRAAEIELKRISFPTDGGTVSFGSYHRPENVLSSASSAGGRFSLQELKTYFDAELGKNGWVFISEKSLEDWGNNVGGLVRRYCKGPLSAAWQYAGPKNVGWTYALSVTWDEKCMLIGDLKGQ